MREYQRTTKPCKFDELPPETLQAIRKYLEKHELSDIEANILMGCETTSTRIQKPGFFAKLFGGGVNFAESTVMFLTPRWLIWCTTDGQNNKTVLAARVSEIEVKDYKSDLIEDSGVEIFGFINKSPERVHAFIPLGEEDYAGMFSQLLKDMAEHLDLDD